MIQLRGYQETLIEKIRASLRSGKKSPLLVSPCGSGKTIILSFLTSQISLRGKRVWILAHRDELIEQISETLCAFSVTHSFISAGRRMDPHGKVFVASVFSAARRLKSVPAPDVIIIDECFPGGTLIDGTPIEKIRVGDTVSSYDEKTGTILRRKVLRVFKNPKPEVLLKISCGDKEIICTKNHPILTTKGKWVQAITLKEGDYVYRLPVRKSDANQVDNLPSLLSNKNGSQEQAGGPAEDERKKSNAFACVERKDDSIAQANQPPTKSSRWKWDAIAASAKNIIRKIRMANRGGGSYKKRKIFWPSYSLQNRYRKQRKENSGRGGRAFPLCVNQESSRQEKRSLLVPVRVDGIEVFKQTSNERSSDGFVYNFEVEETHTYFANEILVHNCHHAIRGSSWGKIVNEFPKALRIGVTATPRRLSGEPLSDLFDDMILGPSVSELIEMGNLSKYKAFAPPGINVSDLPTRAGDYARAELSEAADKPTITGDAIREYSRLAHGKQAVVFCCSVDHARNVAALFTGAGFPSTCLDGKLSREIRRDVVKDFREGRIRVMTSCDIISEGFDLPAIEVAISLRPTKSLALWIQQSGRALRPFPGKEYALILDHSGNIERHGLPDEDRLWSLDGRLKKSKKEKKASIRVCPKCFAAQPFGSTSCSFCGYAFLVSPREVEHIEGQLVEVDPRLLRRKLAQEQAGADTLEALIQLGRKRGHKDPFRWARHVWQARQAKKFSP